MNWLCYLFLNFSSRNWLILWLILLLNVVMSHSRCRNRPVLTNWGLRLNTWLVLHHGRWCAYVLLWHRIILRMSSSRHHTWISLNTRTLLHRMKSMWRSILKLRRCSIINRTLLWLVNKTWLMHQRPSLLL